MRHVTTDLRCTRCFLKPALCMCSELPRVATHTRVVVIMHGFEEHKSTNTGRLAISSLENSELVRFGAENPPLSHNPWQADRVPVILFPVSGAQPISDFKNQKNLVLVALDGNWRQAARLRKRFAAQNIPFAAAPPGAPSAYGLRHEPHAHGMSTYEAIVRSLAVLEEIDVSSLERAFRIFRDRTLWCRGSIKKEDVEGGIPDGILRHAPHLFSDKALAKAATTATELS